MRQHAFEKFINKEKGAKKKEGIRQEKRRVKDEARSRKYEARNKKQTSGDKIQEPAGKLQEPKVRKQNSGFKNPELSQNRKHKGNEITNNLTRQNKQAAGNQQQAGSYRTFPSKSPKGEMPLNKFISHGGICSRREAADLVKNGRVKVNNVVIAEPGFKVADGDKITVNNRQVHIRKNLVYILLNKPKDYITTLKDPQGRKTIFELIKNAPDERIFPVGRLDRNTTGVLLLTNDGELTQKLTHPSFEVKKIYEVRLDKPLHKKDMETVLSGINLDDGIIAADAIGYADMKDKSIIGIEIHSGRNRIVRRIFERLGYDVKNLDRVLFANLTKKNVERGKWRYLSEKEVRSLKFMNQSFVRKKV